MKRNKKQKKRDEAQLIEERSMKKKLLIFDINKVLVTRKPMTTHYRIRPHAHEFVADMAERYELAVWTSMTKKCAKPILADVFPPDRFDLACRWYQNKCTVVFPTALDTDGSNIVPDQGTCEEQKSGNEDEYPGCLKGRESSVNYRGHGQSQPQSHSSAVVASRSAETGETKPAKPIYMKDLNKLFTELPVFTIENTVSIMCKVSYMWVSGAGGGGGGGLGLIQVRELTTAASNIFLGPMLQ